MAQGRDRKILRIGIIQNGKIIEERLLRRRESVTIGQSPRNTFVLPASGVPKSYTLFEVKGGIYQLNFRPNMGGRVSVESAVLDFNQVRDQKLATKRGESYVLPLSEKSRGKVVMDDVTLLFQFVTAPPPPSKLQLPAAVRQSFFKRLDWPFTSTLLASFVVQVFSIAFIVTRDYPEEPRGIDTLPDRFVEMIKAKPPEPPVNLEKEENKEEKGDEPAIEKRPEPKPQPKPQPKPEPEEKPAEEPKTPEQQARADAERLRQVQDKVNKNTILGIVGAKGGDGEDFVKDVLGAGVTDVTIAQAFEGTEGVMVAESASQKRDRRGNVGGETGQVAGIKKDDLRAASGGGPVTTGDKGKEIKVSGKVDVKAPSEAFGTGVLDSNEIASVVKRRAGAIKECYEKQLKRNPKLAGKVRLQFTIEASGRVGQAKILENTTGDSDLGRCIEGKAKGFRFKKPDGGSVTVAFPFVFAPSS